MSTPEESGAQQDDALIRKLRDGDEIAYEAMIRSHGPRMLAVARRFMRDEDEAQDVVQEAFVAAFRSLGSFREGSLLSTWLHRIVVNAALMRLRTRRRRPEESIDELLPRARSHETLYCIRYPVSRLESIPALGAPPWF